MKKIRRVKRKLCISLLLAGTVFSAAPFQSFAAGNEIKIIGPEQVNLSGPGAKTQEGTAVVPGVLPSTVRELFDAEYYRLLYPDLSVLGDDPEALYEHFITYGLKEGRKCSPYLDLAKYISENRDLQEAFGENRDAYVAHYFSVGIKEGRDSYATDFDRYLQTVLRSAENPDRKLYGQALIDFRLKQAQTDETGSRDSDSSESEIQVHQDTIIIPWDYVANGYVTLDMIKAHCGENLILVQNKQGDVTFLAGDISSKSVTDSASALKAVESLFGVLKLDDEADLYLSLTTVRKDSEGNSIYEFMPMDQASGLYATTITDVQEAAKGDGYYQAVVRLKAAGDGTVIALTSTSEDSYTRYQKLTKDGKVIDSRSQAISGDLPSDVTDKYEILGKYDRNYQDSLLYRDGYFVKDKDTGEIGIIYYYYVTHENCYYKIDSKVYEASGGKDSYPLDYLFTQAEYENRTLKDCYGNETTVPVAYITVNGERVYYLASEADKTIMLLRSGMAYEQKGLSATEKDLVKLKLNEDGTLSSAASYLSTGDLVTMYSNILDARRYYQSVDPEKSDVSPYIINYFYTDNTENAYGGDGDGLMFMNYCNSYLLETYDTAVHEVFHSMTQQYFTTYTNYNGAISEAYADIIALCAQQRKYNELVSDYMSKNNATLKEAQEYFCSHFGDFSSTWYAGYYKARNGTVNYLYDADDPCNKHGKSERYATSVGDENFGYFKYGVPGYETLDNYNCHWNSSVLAHVAYEMYHTGVITDTKELSDIWYDSANYITGESEFYDVRYYVEEAMKEHGCSKEAIEAADRLFEESKITLENRDKDLLATPEKLKAENNLSTETADNVLKLQQNTQDDQQAAARVSDNTDEVQKTSEAEQDTEETAAEPDADVQETEQSIEEEI